MTATEQNQNPEGATIDASGPAAEPAAPADPQAEIARLSAEKRDLNDRMLRIAADFENFKRRTRREMDEAGLRGMEGLLKEILPVLDNLDRAVDAGATTGTTSALLEGVRLVQKQFLGALERFQIKTFEAQGMPFDPQVHEAVQQIDDEALPPGTIAQVFQRGYMAGARLLRPALVAVVRARPTVVVDAPSEGEGDEPGAGLN